MSDKSKYVVLGVLLAWMLLGMVLGAEAIAAFTEDLRWRGEGMPWLDRSAGAVSRALAWVWMSVVLVAGRVAWVVIKKGSR